jgi:hypothetical protein
LCPKMVNSHGKIAAVISFFIVCLFYVRKL